MAETAPVGGRDERPAPIVLHDGIVVPGALCAELAAALELLDAYTRGTPPPAACRAPHLSRAVLAVLLSSQDAAARHRAQQHALRAWAAPTVTAPTVLGPAQLASESDVEEEITTTQAADLAGYSPEWWRRLAVRGTIRARQADRNTWLLQRADVIAYANRRPEQETTDGALGHQDRTRSSRAAS